MTKTAKSLAALLAGLSLVGTAARGGVLLTTGEEDHDQPTDLIVYNPAGPNVYWHLSYETRRGIGRDLPNGQMEYQSTDFGEGWTNDYNITFYDEKADPKAAAPPAGDKALTLANGFSATITAPAVPSAANPRAQCTLTTALPSPLTVDWVYDPADSFGTYTLTNGAQVWTFSCLSRASRCYVLTRITDAGHSLAFHYTVRPTPPANVAPFPLLDDIADAATGKALLTLRRDTQNAVQSLSDCYGRSVFYQVKSHPTRGIPKPYAQAYQELDWVSQVVPSGTDSAQAPMRCRYEYRAIPSGFHTEAEPLMTSCAIPSPASRGETTQWTNAYLRGRVTSQTDVNGITRTYDHVDAEGYPTSPPANGQPCYARVVVTDAQGRIAGGFIRGYDADMVPTSNTDLKGQPIPYQDDMPNPTDPGRTPVEDADEARAAWRWRDAQDEKDVSIRLFLGFRNPNFTYDGFGNVLTEGKLAGAKAAYGYAQDGDYTQAEAMTQPLTVTGLDGRMKHFRYDARGNVSEETDPSGQRTRYEYNLMDQLTRATFFAANSENLAGEVRYAYLYQGGPLTEITALNAAGTVVRHFVYRYEPAGHLASITGSRLPVHYTYDALYRPHLVPAPHTTAWRHT